MKVLSWSVFLDTTCSFEMATCNKNTAISIVEPVSTVEPIV